MAEILCGMSLVLGGGVFFGRRRFRKAAAADTGWIEQLHWELGRFAPREAVPVAELDAAA